jgi:hypothetical protein
MNDTEPCPVCGQDYEPDPDSEYKFEDLTSLKELPDWFHKAMLDGNLMEKSIEMVENLQESVLMYEKFMYVMRTKEGQVKIDSIWREVRRNGEN